MTRATFRSELAKFNAQQGHISRQRLAWGPQLFIHVLRVTWRSAFFELSHPRTHIFHVRNAITACLTELSMNFDWFHATQVEESDNHALFFECKRRQFSIKNTTATRPRHRHSTGSTVLPLGLAQPKGQPRLLQQLSRFYLLPFPRKKLGYLTTWTPHVLGCRKWGDC